MVRSIVDGLRGRIVPLLTAACLLAHVALAFHFLGSSNLIPREGRVIHPIGNGDYALQYYYATLGARFLAESGVTFGYDPNFLSGYVKTPVYYPSSTPFEFSLYLFRDFPPGLAFNWTVFAFLALVPFLLYRATVNFGLKPPERLFVLAILLLPPQFLEPQLWLYSIMQAAGMVAFIFASYLSLYIVSLAYRFLVENRWGALVPLAVATPLLFPLHPTTPIFTAVPLLALYARTFRRATLRQHLALWAVAALAVVFLWPWLHAYRLFGHYSDLHAFDQEAAKGHFAAAGGSLLGPLVTFFSSTGVVSRVPIVLGVLGLAAWWKDRDLDRLVVVGSQVAALTAVTYYGDHFGLGPTAPGRFTLPLALYLLLPAAVAATRLWCATQAELGRLLGPRQRQIAAAVVLLLLPDIARFALPAGARSRSSLPEMQTTSGYNTKPDEFSAWLEGNTDRSGRILHEETTRFSYRYYGTYLAALLPLRMHRDFANGPAPFPLLQQNVLRFMAGELQEKPMSEYSTGDVTALLERYDVHWVVCWSPEAKKFFGAMQGTANLVSEFEGFQLYRIDGPWDYFLRGDGEIDTGPNSIWVRHVLPYEDAVVLRFHWDEHMRVDEPAELFPFPVDGDPVPFIGVRHPPPSFQVTFRY